MLYFCYTLLLATRDACTLLSSTLFSVYSALNTTQLTQTALKHKEEMKEQEK